MTAGFEPSPPSVSAELEAIFPEVSRAGPDTASSSKVRGVTGAPRRRIPFAAVGAVVAAGLLGLTAGSALIRPAGGPAPAASPTPQPPATDRVAVASPPATLLAEADAPLAVLEQSPVAKPSRHNPRAGALAPSRRHAGYGDLLAADRRLRAAYSRAVGAGVSRRVLIAYHDRWEDLRHDANWKPDRVAAGYGAMTADLDRIARRLHGPGRETHPRSRLRRRL